MSAAPIPVARSSYERLPARYQRPVSELVSVKPTQRVLDWLEATDENGLFLSVMTLGEIRQGVEALPQSKKRTLLCNHASRVASCRLIEQLRIVGGG